MTTRDYEVRAYKTQSDFDDCRATNVIDGITSKRDALREGKAWLKDHSIVKVQSDDREFIQVLTATSETQPTITLSNFRVKYHAPRYEDGKCLYDGYCAILADDAEYEGRTVRVFDVPDADEGQREVAQFACEAMNAHVQLRDTLRLFKAMDNCNYDLETMRASGLFVAVDEALATTEQIGD